MKNEQNAPKIRFKGFTDAWEQREVSDVAEITAGGTPSTSVKEYWNPKQVPWLSSGEVHKKYITYTDDKISEEGLNHSSARMIKENSVLIALAGQGKTRGTVAINRIPLSTNQSIAAMTFTSEICPEFIFSNLENRYDELRRISSGDGTRGGLNKQLVGDVIIPYTFLKEQQAIGKFFTNLDHLITLHQRKCETLKKLKKSMLQKMFPKNGSHFPEIRFAGFTDAWELREFSQLYKKVAEKNDLSFGTDKIISVANMYFKADTKESSDDYMKTYNIMRMGDIAFEGNKSKNYAHGRFVENTSGDGIVSHVFDVFRPITDYDLFFWKYMINNEGVMGRIMTRCTKASTMMTNLVADDFLKETISIPSIEEQRQIGAYFRTLDHLITLHQRKPFQHIMEVIIIAKRC